MEKNASDSQSESENGKGLSIPSPSKPLSPPPSSSPPASPGPSSPTSSSSPPTSPYPNSSSPSAWKDELFASDEEVISERRRKRKSRKRVQKPLCTPSDEPFDYDKYYKYLDQVDKYEGFYIKLDCPPIGMLGEILELKNIDEDVINAAKFAIKEYNKLSELNLELKRVIRATFEVSCVFLYYITLETTDGDFCEAMVEEGVKEGDYTLELMRDAKYHQVP